MKYTYLLTELALMQVVYCNMKYNRILLILSDITSGEAGRYGH